MRRRSLFSPVPSFFRRQREDRPFWLEVKGGGQNRNPPREILLIVTRRIGDVLLATPVIRTLKAAWPETPVDVLVFEGTQGAIEANPDVRTVHTIAQRPGFMAHARLLMRIARRYALALSLVPGDRPTLYAFIAGRRRAGLLLETARERWKRPFLDRWIPFDDLGTHTVRMHLALTDALGLRASPRVIASWRASDAQEVERLLDGSDGRPLAVLHPYPKFNYKMWHREGWIELARWLDARGYRIALTGGRERDEIDYLARLMPELPRGTINAAGRLTLGGSACLVNRARVFIGPDTAMTHIAAALGIPTVALFGPSNPVKWGPWPRGHPPDRNPWRRCGTQRAGNVILVQGSQPCVPCLLEGCGRSIASFSDCLQQLPARKVIAAVECALESREND